jgi:hypothetical protein
VRVIIDGGKGALAHRPFAIVGRSLRLPLRFSGEELSPRFPQRLCVIFAVKCFLSVLGTHNSVLSFIANLRRPPFVCISFKEFLHNPRQPGLTINPSRLQSTAVGGMVGLGAGSALGVYLLLRSRQFYVTPARRWS